MQVVCFDADARSLRQGEAGHSSLEFERDAKREIPQPVQSSGTQRSRFESGPSYVRASKPFLRQGKQTLPASGQAGVGDPFLE
jgi:hypothetical protein